MTKRNNKTHLPWAEVAHDRTFGLKRVIHGLLRTMSDNERNPDNHIPLSEKDEKRALLQFKKSEAGQSHNHQFMQHIADQIGATCERGPAKDIIRYLQKHNLADRNTNDAHRGRILISNSEQYEKLIELLNKADSEGYLPTHSTSSIRVIPNSTDDYIKKQRKSGYSGSVNFDVLYKDECPFEIQVMPDSYQRTYDHSHRLFDMIRMLEETPKHMQSREQLMIKTALIRANRALFDEDAYRHGFMECREKGPNRPPTEKVLLKTNDILDRLSENLGNNPKEEWAIETKDAIAYAKTSLTNLYIGGLKQSTSQEARMDFD